MWSALAEHRDPQRGIRAGVVVAATALWITLARRGMIHAAPSALDCFYYLPTTA
ncbi:MAG TPA: hypothetical protein VJV03_07725 [Pyrinomonadaceae bacterium]|nr:hypothetical protein [Pyrinomonadaceae bacterium]